MPTLRVVETDEMNAFASGLHEGRFSVTVTRGILQAMDDGEHRLRQAREALLGQHHRLQRGAEDGQHQRLVLGLHSRDSGEELLELLNRGQMGVLEDGGHGCHGHVGEAIHHAFEKLMF